jgi:uncharacterized flavoprotein (TIGR03862 family)
MAAEVLAASGVGVTVFEHMPSVGRKLLLAGRSGLNLTHGEPLERMITRYGAQRDRLAPALRAFDADALRAWCAGLGEPTFIGTSGRVFPASLRATPLLRAWLVRLADLGVAMATRERWTGWSDQGGLTFVGTDGTVREVVADITVLALGGASWPRVGSDGGWVGVLRGVGIDVRDLRAANCGVIVPWSEGFVARHAGSPLKNVGVSVAGSEPGPVVRGDMMITRRGLEGGPVYLRTAEVRAALDRDGSAVLLVDLQPDLHVTKLVERLRRRRPKDSMSSTLKRTVGLSPTTVAWLREVTAGTLPTAPAELAGLLKAVPVTVVASMPIERAISTAGGVSFDEIDDHFMLRRRPGTFVIGEMLDWEAPTGGYLLQATFSTAGAAARAAAAMSGC